MAANKYELCTFPTEVKGPPRHFPWYKERLKWKYLYNQQKQLNTLISNKWRFVAGGTDDFRSGIPRNKTSTFPQKKPILSVPLIIENDESLSNLVKRKTTPPSYKSVSPIAAKTLYSKVGPRRQIQQNRMTEVQNELLKHPLGLYSYLEEGIPVELAHDVIQYLDSSLKLTDSMPQIPVAVDSESSTIFEEDIQDEGSQLEEQEEQIIHDKTKIYCWPLKKSDEEIEEERIAKARQKAVSPTQEAHVNHVTHDLIQWTRNLDESNSSKEYLDEDTIKRLFASDYEAKPILTAPIHVMELSNVPNELRVDSRGCTASSLSSAYCRLSAIERQKQIQEHVATGGGFQVTSYPKKIRTRYGAWYLKPSMWKLTPSDEPLEDPELVKKRNELQAKIQNESLDAVLSETHGARAFQQFVSSKYQRSLPEFFRAITSGKEKARRQTVNYS